jgi:hypothetical protein
MIPVARRVRALRRNRPSFRLGLVGVGRLLAVHLGCGFPMSCEPSTMQVPPPKDWQAFERRLRDLFEAHWHFRATMHGRTGPSAA